MISLLQATGRNSKVNQWLGFRAKELRDLARGGSKQRDTLLDLGLIYGNGRHLKTIFDAPVIEEQLKNKVLDTLFTAIEKRDLKEIARISKRYPALLALAKEKIQRGEHKGLGALEEIFTRAFPSSFDGLKEEGLQLLKDTLALKEFGGLYGFQNPQEAYIKALELALKLKVSAPPLKLLLQNPPENLGRAEFIVNLERLLAKILTRELDLVFSHTIHRFSETEYNLQKIEMLCNKIHALRKKDLGDDPDAKISLAATDWLRLNEFGAIKGWDKWNLQNRYVFNDGISAYFSGECETKKKLVSILRSYAPDNLRISYEKLFAGKA